jgi:Tfp pilus assembly protein PilF
MRRGNDTLGVRSEEATMDGERADDVAVYDLYQQGRARLAGGNPYGAAAVLELAVSCEPRKASLHEALGRAYFASARVARAREEFTRAIELDPTDAYAHFSVGRCHEREDDLDRAATHYKLACALSDRPEYAEALRRIRRRRSALEALSRPGE